MFMFSLFLTGGDGYMERCDRSGGGAVHDGTALSLYEQLGKILISSTAFRRGGI